MNNNTRPSFWRRFFLALVKTIFWGVVLIALAVGGYLFLRELRRSFDSVAARIEINRRDIEALRDEAAEIAAQAPAQQRELGALQMGVEGLDTRLANLQAEATGDLERQGDQLAAMEEALAAAIETGDAALSNSQAVNEDAAALGTAVVALQGDLNETNSRVDALGGEIDTLRADGERLNATIEALGQSVDSATETAAGVTEFKKTLALFQVWELVTRARLRLLEDNVGLATADLERAFRAVDFLITEEPGEDEEALMVLQTRLALTLSNIPDNLNLATNDLESLWDELDRMLTARVLPELAVILETEAAETVTPEVTPTPTPSPAP